MMCFYSLPESIPVSSSFLWTETLDEVISLHATVQKLWDIFIKLKIIVS